MLSERKSDPCYLTATPNTRRTRRLRKQKTTVSRQNSGSDVSAQGSHLYQMLMNTKSTVQGIGYNMRNYLFDDSQELALTDPGSSRVWLLGSLVDSTADFYAAWNRIFRMTYRKRWPDPIVNPCTGISYDSDVGWGCTIRSCQMLMAQVLLRMNKSPESVSSYFADTESSLLSIQSFVSAQRSIPAGQWFGPASVSSSLKRLIESDEGFDLGLGLVLSTDGQVLISDIMDQSRTRPLSPSLIGSSSASSTGRANSWQLCNGTEGVVLSSSLSGGSSCLEPSPRILSEFSANQEFWVIDEPEHDGESDESIVDISERRIGTLWSRPVLVMVAMRLSPGSELSPAQLCALLSYMTIPSFVGLIGGPDRRCHFIAGLLEERSEAGECFEYTLLSVDPHIVQEAVTTGESVGFKNSLNPSRISPSYLCPSIGIGFLLKRQSDLEELREQLLAAGDTGTFIQITSKDIFPSRTPSPVVVLE